MVAEIEVHRFTEYLFSNCTQLVPGEIYRLQVAEFHLIVEVFASKGGFNILPLLHLLSENSPPSSDQTYHVYIIDRDTHESMLPEKCWQAQDVLANTSIAGFAECNIYTSLEADSGNFYMVDHAKRQAVKIFNLESDKAYDWEFSYPLRKLLNQFTRDTPYVLVHAGGVGLLNENVGIVLTGKGESGKSTVCAVSVSENVGYAGDDFLLVNTESNYAWCLYTSLKARPHLNNALSGFPVFKEGMGWEVDEKSNYYVPYENLNCISKQFHIKALVKPVYGVDNQIVSFLNLRPGEMMRYMALSTITIVRGSIDSDSRTFTKISQLVKNVPCYQFSYNNDFFAIREAVKQFLFKLVRKV